MREASRRRDALAQQIASQYQVNPKVAAMLVEGSVARDAADHSSDLDLAVFWAEPPTPQERRDLVKRAGGSSRHAWPSHGEVTGWSERFEKEGIPIDVRHTTVAATEGILAAVLERADPRLAKQERLAALRSALPPAQPDAHHRLAEPGGCLSARAGRGDGSGALSQLVCSNRDRACEDGRGEEACQPETRGWPQRPSSSGLRCREFSR